MVDDQKFIFNAYLKTDDGLPLYLYTTVSDNKMAGKISLSEIFNDTETQLWKEVIPEEGKTPGLIEFSISDLTNDELSMANVYIPTN